MKEWLKQRVTDFADKTYGFIVRVCRDRSVRTLIVAGIAGGFGALVAGISSSHAREAKIFDSFAKTNGSYAPFTQACTSSNERCCWATPDKYPVHLFGRDIHLGMFGDFLIGVAAGIAVLMITTHSDAANAGSPLIRVVPMSIVAGIAGAKLLTGLAGDLQRRVDRTEMVAMEVGNRQNALQVATEDIKTSQSNLLEVTKKAEEEMITRGEVTPLLAEGKEHLSKKFPVKAQAALTEALLVNSNYWEVHYQLGRAFRAQGADDKATVTNRLNMEKAVAALDRAMSCPATSEQKGKILYNRACYQAMLDIPDAALKDLQEAIRLNTNNLSFAREDRETDFRNLNKKAAFNDLISAPQVPPK
jgi:hypothetical protein